MARPAKKVIRLKVEEIEIDPTQWKPWKSTFKPEEMYVDVAIPKDEVTISPITTGDRTILTLDGFKMLLKEVGLKLYELNEEFTTEVRKSKVKSTNISKKK